MGVEADGDDVEFFAHVELHHAQRILESAENLSTKHGAGEVDQVEDDGLLAEVVAEANGAAEVVGEGQIRGNGLTELLQHADIWLRGPILESPATRAGPRDPWLARSGCARCRRSGQPRRSFPEPCPRFRVPG